MKDESKSSSEAELANQTCSNYPFSCYMLIEADAAS
jgi:hypothetical protein